MELMRGRRGVGHVNPVQLNSHQCKHFSLLLNENLLLTFVLFTSNRTNPNVPNRTPNVPNRTNPKSHAFFRDREFNCM